MAVVSDVTGGGRSCRSDYSNSSFLWFIIASVKNEELCVKYYEVVGSFVTLCPV